LEGFSKIMVTLHGESGLVLDNIEAMINPLAKRKKELVAKKGLTDADQEEVFLLEWRMGLYLDTAGEPVVPAKCIMASMTQAARALRLGKALERGALQLTAAEVPIIYDGPRSIEGLWNDPRFQFKTIVNLTPTTATRSMGVRCRPIFRDWAVRFEAVVMLDMINMPDVETILEITGRQGLCNARRIGYGRFTSEITKL
jgi:hypothetical protein